MKIAFVTQPWAGIGEGGAIGLLTCKLAQNMARTEEVMIYGRNGYCDADIRVVSRHLGIGIERIIDRILKGMNRRWSIWPRERPYYSCMFYYFWYAVRLAADLRKNRCDIVHIHMLSQFIPVIKFINPGIKIVLHNHLEWLGFLDKKMLFRRLAAADLILECSRHNREVAVSRFPELEDKCRVCFNGVDLKRFHPHPVRNNKVKTLIFVGRVSPEKGAHLLIEAFNIVLNTRSDVRLMLIGPENSLPFEQLISLSDEPLIKGLSEFYNGTPYKSRLKAMIAPDNESCVDFRGFVANADLPSYYNSADIFINASLIEAFPLPLVEAMGSGLPVIAPAVGGIPEVVEDGKSGLLFEAGNAVELAQKILILLSDEDLRSSIAANGRQRAASMFSWEIIAGNLLDDYRELFYNNK